MDKATVERAIEELKCPSTQKVMSSLSRIRHHIITKEEGMVLFRELGGLDVLLQHLRKPNEQILNLALSILGNCCLEHESAVIVGNPTNCRPLITILRTVGRDSLLGRVCRVLGNLAKEETVTYTLCEFGAPEALVNLFEVDGHYPNENVSKSTLRMAIRALRYLWVDMTRWRSVQYDIVNKITKFLVNECVSTGVYVLPEKQENSVVVETTEKHKHLMSGLLNFLCIVTEEKNSDFAEYLLYNGPLRKIYGSLIKDHEGPIVRCLANLCYIPYCRPILGQVGFVHALSKCLQGKTVSSWPDGAIEALALLSSESVNRAKLRTTGGLTHLITAAKHHLIALEALQHYLYDDLSFVIFLRKGLITFLTDELKNLTVNLHHEHSTKNRLVNSDLSDSDDEGDEKVSHRQRIQERLMTTPECILKNAKLTKIMTKKENKRKELVATKARATKRNQVDRDTVSVKRQRSDAKNEREGEGTWSPASTSTGPWSPGSATYYGDADVGSNDSEVSGRYSPVFSETEAHACEVPQEEDMPNQDEAVPEDEDTRPYYNSEGQLVYGDQFNVFYTKRRVSCILLLLNHVASNQLPRDDTTTEALETFASQKCINILLDYAITSKRPFGKAAHIVFTLLGDTTCLITILNHRFILRLYDLCVNPKHPPSCCYQCKQTTQLGIELLSQLSVTCQQLYANGEIRYHLHRGTDQMRKTLAITLPFVAWNTLQLRQYYVACGALNTLLNNTDEELKHTVTALSMLAHKIQVKNPKTIEKRYKEQIYYNYDPILDRLQPDEIITFLLDDDSTVLANKTYLCNKSDYFNAMLNGQFMESHESQVRLKKVTKPALELLLTLLNLDLNSQIKVFPLSKELEVNLEVVLLADRFLFETVKLYINSAILQFSLTPNTVDKMYSWSLSDGMGHLCVESVAYVLTGDMEDSDRVKCFESIMRLEYKEQWLSDVKAIILRHIGASC